MLANMTPITSHVLLVDDNKEAVDMFSQLLNLHDVENMVAYDGPTALAILADWPVDIVFLDIRMPCMDGYEAASAMHALPGYGALPIVAWTAWNSHGNQKDMWKAGMVACLTKPVALEAVLELIRRYGTKH